MSQWYEFMIKVGAGPPVYFAIGYVYTDIGVVIANMSLIYVQLTLMTLLGTILGAWFMGKALGFFPVESAVTAGLCMADMGGSGDHSDAAQGAKMAMVAPPPPDTRPYSPYPPACKLYLHPGQYH